MRPLSLIVTLLLPIVMQWGFTATAAPALPDPWDSYDEAEFMDMDLEQNIATPALDRSEKHYIRTRMRSLADEIAALPQRYTVDLDRSEEVIVLTLPTDDLFLPNDTLLAPRYGRLLDPLLRYLTDPGQFKLVYCVHTDNTGSEAYNTALAQRRVNTLYDFFLDNLSEDQVVIPFAMGDSDPVEPNTSRRGRAANRRLELYLIPGPSMILKARAAAR